MTRTQSVQQQQSYRWVILVAMCVIGFMTIGTRSTVSSFLKTIIADLGTNRETISFIVAANIWLSGLLQPFAGYVMDRFGARGLFTASVALYGLGIGLIGLTHSVWYLFVIYGVLVGAASAGASMSLTNALLAQWFKDWRALAMSINNAGGAVGTLFVVGTMSPWLLSSFGWRFSHIYLGAAVLLLAAPLGLVIPRRRRAASEGGPAPAELQHTVRGPLETQSWAQALRSAPLWQLNGSYFVCGMTVSLFTIHFIPFATDRGFTLETAARAFGLMAMCSVAGSLLSGVLSDRLGRKNVLTLAYLIRAGTFAQLLLWHHEMALYVFAVVGGLVWLATPPSTLALTGEIYGLRSLGTLGSVSLLAHQIGGGVSVWLAGKLYDLTGSYDISFTLATIALLAASLISFGIAERRYSVRYLTPAPSTVGD
jgi:MFS family permease